MVNSIEVIEVSRLFDLIKKCQLSTFKDLVDNGEDPNKINNCRETLLMAFLW